MNRARQIPTPHAHEYTHVDTFKRTTGHTLSTLREAGVFPVLVHEVERRTRLGEMSSSTKAALDVFGTQKRRHPKT